MSFYLGCLESYNLDNTPILSLIHNPSFAGLIMPLLGCFGWSILWHVSFWDFSLLFQICSVWKNLEYSFHFMCSTPLPVQLI